MSKIHDFINNFFDGLKTSAVDSMIQRAEQNKIHSPPTKLEELRKEREELDAIIKKYSTKKSPKLSDEDDDAEK